ncbi:hypothetical protein A3K73_01895 [Candidatus Pacearchaeota archaeon RBG_13_36_9]|nr:MAG: hypothetical protein A3K73_01895 [Candidatus Pacearchaeota archaeon RBG_13_36_9]
MDTEERGLIRRIGKYVGVLQDKIVSRKVRTCKCILDSMGGAEGPQDDGAYRQIFGQEPPVIAYEHQC